MRNWKGIGRLCRPLSISHQKCTKQKQTNQKLGVNKLVVNWKENSYSNFVPGTHITIRKRI